VKRDKAEGGAVPEHDEKAVGVRGNLKRKIRIVTGVAAKRRLLRWLRGEGGGDD